MDRDDGAIVEQMAQLGGHLRFALGTLAAACFLAASDLRVFGLAEEGLKRPPLGMPLFHPPIKKM